MVLTCSKCEARLQLDEAKAPARPFTVRCPKCQGAINVQPGASSEQTGAVENSNAPAASTPPSFERQVSAPAFHPKTVESSESSGDASSPGLDAVAKLLAAALQQADTGASKGRRRKRPAWDRRKVLVCASPAYREAIAISLVDCDYEVFVAENTAQALGRM